jgi:membrane peptidoglycan carboxypeptidase
LDASGTGAGGTDGTGDDREPTRPSFIPPDAGTGQGAVRTSGAPIGWPAWTVEAAGRARRIAGRAWKPALIAGAVGLLAAGVLLTIAYLMTPIPSGTQPGAIAQGSIYYYSDGKTVITRQGVNRTTVPLAEVPEQARQAVISAENHTFLKDSGVDLKGTLRAAWSTLTGGQVQGGSTITQQMVRNYYGGFSQERTLSRKLREIVVAHKVGTSRSKDWILEKYLNTIYFGRGAYGIQAAARAYYGKDVRDLTTAEGAYLAAAIQQPSVFGAASGAEHAQPDPQAVARWRYVLSGMVKSGALSQAQAAGLTFPTPRANWRTSGLAGQQGYMVQAARDELKRRGYTDDEIDKGGLKIVTTFDRDLMGMAKEAVTSLVPAGTPKAVRTGLAAVEPDTGAVVAFYGGKDYLQQQFDNVFSAKVQAGSGFKPYVLAAALNAGDSLDTVVDGDSPQYFRGTAVKNNAGRSYGDVDLVTATQESINTAYVNLGLSVGLKNVVAMAESMGVPAAQLEQHAAAPTLSIGVASVSPVQQAGAYATFAADGVHRETHVLKSVTDTNGHTETITARSSRAFGSAVADDASYALSQVVESGTGTGARLADGRPMAGKTGTTDGGKAIWFTGYTRQLATSVAIFRGDNRPVSIPGYATYGGTLPAAIWKAFMTKAMEGLPMKDITSSAHRNYADPYSYGNQYGDQYGNPYGDQYGNPYGNPDDPTSQLTRGDQNRVPRYSRNAGPDTAGTPD